MVRTMPSRRNITPPWTLTEILRLARQKRSLRTPAPEREEEPRQRGEAEPRPREARSVGGREPPRRRVEDVPGLAAAPVNREVRPVHPEHDVPERPLVGRGPRDTRAVGDPLHRVECVDERRPAGVRVERVDPAAAGADRARDRLAWLHPA